MAADNTDTHRTYKTRNNHTGYSFVIYIFYFLFACLFLLVPVKLIADVDPQNLEQKIKAAYLYNFTKFIIWPEKIINPEEKTTFNICIIELNPFGHALDLLRNKMVNGLSLVTEVRESEADLDHCQIVYFPKAMQQSYIEILFRLEEKNILTVSDIAGFVNNGGHIGLDTVKGKVRFDINLVSTKSSGLKISAKLLELAMTVVEQ